MRVAVEFRHPSWHCEEVFALLAAHRAAYCVMSGANLPCVLRATTDFVYVRMHGPCHEHKLARGTGRATAGKPIPLLVLRAGPHEPRRVAGHRSPVVSLGRGRDRIVVVLTDDTDREEIRKLVTYKILAPKKLTALLD